MSAKDLGPVLRCSFCNKSNREVRLIAGPTVYICNECVDTCLSIIYEGDNRLARLEATKAWVIFEETAEASQLTATEFMRRLQAEDAGILDKPLINFLRAGRALLLQFLPGNIDRKVGILRQRVQELESKGSEIQEQLAIARSRLRDANELQKHERESGTPASFRKEATATQTTY